MRIAPPKTLAQRPQQAATDKDAAGQGGCSAGTAKLFQCIAPFISQRVGRLPAAATFDTTFLTQRSTCNSTVETVIGWSGASLALTSASAFPRFEALPPPSGVSPNNQLPPKSSGSITASLHTPADSAQTRQGRLKGGLNRYDLPVSHGTMGG